MLSSPLPFSLSLLAWGTKRFRFPPPVAFLSSFSPFSSSRSFFCPSSPPARDFGANNGPPQPSPTEVAQAIGSDDHDASEGPPPAAGDVVETPSCEAVNGPPGGNHIQTPKRLKRRLIGHCQLSGQALYDAGDGTECIFPYDKMEMTGNQPIAEESKDSDAQTK